jgi:hypothetical protein
MAGQLSPRSCDSALLNGKRAERRAGQAEPRPKRAARGRVLAGQARWASARVPQPRAASPVRHRGPGRGAASLGTPPCPRRRRRLRPPRGCMQRTERRPAICWPCARERGRASGDGLAGRKRRKRQGRRPGYDCTRGPRAPRRPARDPVCPTVRGGRAPLRLPETTKPGNQASAPDPPNPRSPKTPDPKRNPQNPRSPPVRQEIHVIRVVLERLQEDAPVVQLLRRPPPPPRQVAEQPRVPAAPRRLAAAAGAGRR